MLKSEDLIKIENQIEGIKDIFKQYTNKQWDTYRKSNPGEFNSYSFKELKKLSEVAQKMKMSYLQIIENKETKGIFKKLLSPTINSLYIFGVNMHLFILIYAFVYIIDIESICNYSYSYMHLYILLI
jgi:hypothetical protein